MSVNTSGTSIAPKSTKKQPFTSFERGLIVALVRERPIIEDKRTSANNNELKKQAWDELTVVYNAQSYVSPRNCTQLKRCWENMKSQRKKERCQKPSHPSTGGASQGVSDSNSSENSDDAEKPDYVKKLKIEQPDELDSIEVEINENKKRKPNLDFEEVFFDIPNIPDDSEEEEHEPSEPIKTRLNTGGTSSVGNNKLRLKLCNLHIQQARTTHKLRLEREKILIQREKNLLNFEKEMHCLQLEKLRLEIDILKKQQ